MDPSMTFAVHCPHCRGSNEDPFEVMPRGDIDWVTCSSCSKRFFFLLAECAVCEGESVFTWPGAPVPPWTSALCCGHCGRPLELSDDVLVAKHVRDM